MLYLQLLELSKWLKLIINSEFGVCFERGYLEELLMRKYCYYRVGIIAVYKLLKRVRPKIIVEVVGYSDARLIINEVASELGIPTYELQHGIIDKKHIAYNFAIKRNYAFFPDKMLIWGEHFREAKFPIEDENIIVTGFPYFEKNIRLFPPKSNTVALRILVLSQPEYSEKLLQQIMELLDLLDEAGECYSLVYKPHPEEYRYYGSDKWDVFKKYENAILAPQGVSLYEWFSKSNIQVSVSSTAVYEGLAYGLKTFLYSVDQTNMYMNTLVDEEYAHYFMDALELVNLLRDNSCIKDINIDKFFEKRAKENILREMRRNI